MKHGVQEVVGLNPNWGNILGVFHPARLPGKAFAVNMSLQISNSEFIYNYSPRGEALNSRPFVSPSLR